MTELIETLYQGIIALLVLAVVMLFTINMNLKDKLAMARFSCQAFGVSDQ